MLSKNEASRFGPFSLELSLADVCVVRAVTVVVATVIVAFCPPVVAVVGIGGRAVDEKEPEADEGAAVDDVGFGAGVLFTRGG